MPEHARQLHNPLVTYMWSTQFTNLCSGATHDSTAGECPRQRPRSCPCRHDLSSTRVIGAIRATSAPAERGSDRRRVAIPTVYSAEAAYRSCAVTATSTAVRASLPVANAAVPRCPLTPTELEKPDINSGATGAGAASSSGTKTPRCQIESPCSSLSSFPVGMLGWICRASLAVHSRLGDA